ncbi:MAG: hypothetical protein IKO42_06195 [Opitutales bacterium]|nr:hypothetical protein [Opitutales bacterium]
MECYGLLGSLALSGFDLKNFATVKVVSDFSENCDIEKNIPNVMQNCALHIEKWLVEK